MFSVKKEIFIILLIRKIKKKKIKNKKFNKNKYAQHTQQQNYKNKCGVGMH